MFEIFFILKKESEEFLVKVKMDMWCWIIGAERAVPPFELFSHVAGEIQKCTGDFRALTSNVVFIRDRHFAVPDPGKSQDKD